MKNSSHEDGKVTKILMIWTFLGHNFVILFYAIKTLLRKKVTEYVGFCIGFGENLQDLNKSFWSL